MKRQSRGESSEFKRQEQGSQFRERLKTNMGSVA